ncbi:MAG TPA: hypothetical protein VL860_11860 [Planctomycetota bacterium]|nr:hypothetical protein [Planctomycetota bacterium]
MNPRRNLTRNPDIHRALTAGLATLAGAAWFLFPVLPAQDVTPPAPATPPPSAVAPVAPGAQATPAPKTPPPGADQPAPGNPGAMPAADAPGGKIVKAIPGRFSVQVPAGMFQFQADGTDKNKLIGLHLKASVNGVIVSILASKAAAADLDAAVDKAVAQAMEHSKLTPPNHTEWTYAGHKAYKYEFTTAVKDKPSVYFSYVLRDDERVYIFTASVYTTHRADFEPVFDAIAKSIAKDSSNPDANPKPDAKPGEAQP